MENSSLIVLAQVLGPVAIIASCSLLANQKRLKKLIIQAENNDLVQFMSGAIRMFAWLLIISVTSDTTELINVLFHVAGAMVAVIGAAGLLFPDVESQILKRTSKNHNFVNAVLVGKLLVGLLLTVFGYINM